jgi:hypothetical protein
MSNSGWNILLAGGGSIVLMFLVRSFWAKEALRDRMEHNRIEAKVFFRNLVARGRLTMVEVNMVLDEGEFAILKEPSRLLEDTRIREMHIGVGASESYRRLRKIGDGLLVLTNRRLVFDGGSESRTANLADIVSASPWSDAVAVSTSRRQKSEVYRVANPIIWAEMIKNLASGNITVEVPPAGTPGSDF